MSDPARDTRFGATAVRMGLITQAQLDECLGIQSQMRGMGMDESLGDILVKKGYLNSAQTTQVLKAMGVDVSPIPGYRLMARLGQGGMGTVYKARHLKMDRTVALKVIRVDLAKDPQFVDRFYREARAAARLSHRNIVGAFDVGEAGGHYFLAMEFVEGKPLSARLLGGGRVGAEVAADVMLQTARALEYIAANSMIHRDVKPENLMVTADGVVKLCDFGLAKSRSENVSLTATGLTLGTPMYMSPEQISGDKDIDGRADLYSLGATIYHALAGQPPFPGSNPGEVVSKHLMAPLPPLRAKAPDVPAELASIVEKCLRKKREERYATAADLAADLERFQRGEKPQAATPTRHRVAAPRPQRMPPWAVPGVVAVLLLAGLVFVLWPSPAPPPPQENRVADKPREDPRVAELLSRADELVRREQWDEAIPILEELTTKHRAAVAARAAELEQSLDLGRRSIAERKSREEKLRKAKAHAELEEWAAAEVLAKELGAEPQAVEILKACKAELECRRDLDAARALVDRGEWEKAERALRDLLAVHGGTKTLAPIRPSLEFDLETCVAEREATVEIRRISLLEAESRWEEILRELRAVEEKHGRSRSWLAAAAALRALRAKAMRATADAVRKEADQKWARAAEAVRGDDWAGGKKLLEAWRAEYEAADFFSERKPELESMLARCADQMRLAAEKAAEGEGRSADALFSRKKFEEAAAEYSDLLEDHAETEYVRKNHKKIETRIRECEKEMGKAVSGKVFEDFEKGIGGWAPTGTAGRLPVLAVAKEDRKGKNALRATLPGDPAGQTAWASFGLPVKGLPADTVSIRFWVRLAQGGKATLALDLSQPNPQNTAFVTFRSKFEATAEWKPVTIEVSKLELLWAAQGEKPVFTPASASRIAFYRNDYAKATTNQNAQYYTFNDAKSDFVLLVDDIEFVRKK